MKMGARRKSVRDGVGAGLGAHEGTTNLQGLKGGGPHHGKLSAGSREPWACRPHRAQSLPVSDNQAPGSDRTSKETL